MKKWEIVEMDKRWFKDRNFFKNKVVTENSSNKSTNHEYLVILSVK